MSQTVTIQNQAGYLDNLPVGSIIAWHRDLAMPDQSTPLAVDLPPGWVACNGQPLVDPDSILNGATIPNLNGAGGELKRFLRGAEKSGEMENDQIKDHVHLESSDVAYHHTHPGGLHSHSVSLHEVATPDPQQASEGFSSDFLNTNLVQGAITERQVGSSGMASADTSTTAEFMTGPPVDTLGKTVGAGTENFPANMWVIWIMKVKHVASVTAGSVVQSDVDSPKGSVFINQAGNVGVGTQMPQAKLDVGGKIKTTSLSMTGDGINGVTVNSISNDPALGNANPNALVTEAAVKGYLGQAGSGIPSGYMIAGFNGQPAPAGFVKTSLYSRLILEISDYGRIIVNNMFDFILSEVIAVGGIYYITGGYDHAGPSLTPSKRVFTYNPVDNTVAEIAPMNVGRYSHHLVEANGVIYAVGGKCHRTGETPGYFNSIEKYDPATTTWTELTGWNTNNGNDFYYAVHVLNGSVYVLHGYGPTDGGMSYGPISVMEKYDPDTDSWSPAAPLPVTNQFVQYNHNSLVHNGFLYVFGGYWSDISGDAIRTDVFQYDPLNNTWDTLPPMPRVRYYEMAVYGYQDKLYVYGGYAYPIHMGMTTLEMDSYDMDIYDLTTGQWETIVAPPDFQVIPESIIQKNKAKANGALVLGASYDYGYTMVLFSTLRRKFIKIPFVSQRGGLKFYTDGQFLRCLEIGDIIGGISYISNYDTFSVEALANSASGMLEYFQKV